MLYIEKKEQGRCIVLCLRGEISYETAEQMRQRIREESATRINALILDFSEVEFLDTAGASALLNLTDNETEIIFSSVPGAVHDTMLRVGISGKFRDFDSTADAVLKLQ